MSRTPETLVAGTHLAHVRWVELRADALQAFVQGRELAALVEGPVYSMSGPKVGDFSREDLHEIVRIFNTLRHRVPIDWEHSSTRALQGGEAAGPDEGGLPLGEIAAMRVDETVSPARLMVTPMWTAHGLEVVRKAGGVLWMSPTLLSGRPVDRRTQEPLGRHLPLAIALTVHPAQRPDLLDRVVEYSLRLNDDGPGGPRKEPPMEGENGAPAGAGGGDQAAELERLRAQVTQLMQEKAALEAQLAAAKAAPAPAPAAEPAAMAEMRAQLTQLSAQHKATEAQLKTLSAQNEALALQADLERQRAITAHRERALDTLVAEGKAAPSERRLAGYDHDAEVKELSAALQKAGAKAEEVPGTLDELHAEATRRGVKIDTLSLHFTKEWRGRAAGAVVQLGARLGHGGAVVSKDKETVIKEYRATLHKRASENGTTWAVEHRKEREGDTPMYQEFCKARGGAA